jgi:curved DNA-binding protein CbpA
VVLGLTLPCGIDDVKASYRRLAKTAHPDAGGRAADFIAIESAYREALAYCERYGPHLAS